MEKINITLRRELPADYRETEDVVREAFWNKYIPGCDEHYLVHIMRDCPAFLPELDIVALHGDKIIGNVVYVKTVIKGDDGRDYTVLSLGPIAVLPEYQGRGVGGSLIDYTGNLAREMGHRAIFLFGDPDYYSKQGFLLSGQFCIRTAENRYSPAHQVCPLYDGALAGIAGRYIEHPIYEIDKAKADEFEKGFPKKEKIHNTPSQIKFKKMLAMQGESE